MHRASCGLVLAALVWAAPAHAQLDDLFISGFVSQGYFNSSGNEYLIDKSEKGSAEFNEAALVFYSQPTDRVRIGVQLFARDFGNNGNNVVVLDWAFGDYQWKDELGFRVGKVRLPWGLYNQVRDVDVARDQIFLPQSVYNEDFRDFLLAGNGLQRVGAGIIHQGYPGQSLHCSRGYIHGYSGEVGDLLVSAGKAIEQQALARVRAADEDDSTHG